MTKDYDQDSWVWPPDNVLLSKYSFPLSGTGKNPLNSDPVPGKYQWTSNRLYMKGLGVSDKESNFDSAKIVDFLAFKEKMETDLCAGTTER